MDSPAIVRDEDCALQRLIFSLMGGLKNLSPFPISRTLLMNDGFSGLECNYLRGIVGSLEFSSVKSKEHSAIWIRAKEVPGWTPDLVEDSG
ncbi:hypothetical protein Tco_0805066 [Tanacetum coccineum]